MAKLALVAVDGAAWHFDKLYTYLVPDLLDVKPGCRVRVPFGGGNRLRTAIVLELREGESAKLKAVGKLLDPAPVLGEEGLLLLRHLKEHTFCTWFDALRLLIPAGLGLKFELLYTPGPRPLPEHAGELQTALHAFIANSKEPVAAAALAKRFGDETPGALDTLTKAEALTATELHRQQVRDEKITMIRPVEDWEGPLTPKQKQVWHFLQEHGAASLKEALYYTGVTRAVLDNLRGKGAVAYYEQPTPRNPYAGADREEAPPVELSPEQQKAFEQLRALCGDDPRDALLYGVTGSGKTQVFLRLLAHVLDSGKRALVLLPEISLTAQALESYHARFGGRVAVLHSGLSLGERMDEWRRIRDGGADIVVGTRSAVFAPISNLGLIVIDEEQEHTYKSDKSPRFHAREIARLRCHHHGALLLLASATPSVESYWAARQNRCELVRLEGRYGGAVLPDVEIVDMGQAENLSETPSLSLPLREELYENLRRGEQSILLLNRRGHSTLVKCAACGGVEECPHCSVAMTYHTANDSLLCHYCGYTRHRPKTCAHCGSELVRYTGAGTQKLEQELQGVFPDARVLRVDMDTTMAKFSHERLFGAFAAGEYDIMIGTQMVAKGLNFPRVTLVGVLNADQSLYANDFRSFERSFSLLTQVVGRCGRGQLGGRALVQTYSPDNPVIRLAAQQDYPTFFHDEIHSRKIHLYPPFCAMGGVGFVGEREKSVRDAARAFLKEFKAVAARDYPDLPLRMLGPVPADVVKAAGKYRYKLILKYRGDARTRQLLRDMLAWFYGNVKQVSIFIDPFYDRI